MSSSLSGSVSAKMMEEQNEVSYTVLDVEGNPDDVLTKVATAINVRLALGSQTFPLLESDKFRSLILMDKVFLYGPSGCGKSRTMFEIMRRNIGSFAKIYVINPRNNIGTQSGRIRLEELISLLGDEDAVIWDNFPDDLIRRDISNAKKVLEMITSRSVRKLVVSLKPKYLELFKDVPFSIPEFYTHYVAYDKDGIKNLLRLYGSVNDFKPIYEMYIVKDLEKISKILWQKEPTPLTVLDYYNELRQKRENTGSIDAVSEAENLLRSTSYYEHQFALLTGMPERRNEVDFLYTLKLSYELGLERDGSKLGSLQKAIFGSGPVEAPNEKLSTWTYLSGQQYSMHDVLREAVDFTDYVKIKIMNYISQNFSDIIVDKDMNFIHALGMFVGRNISFLPRGLPNQLLPESLAEYMNANDSFEHALGVGVGEAFESIEEELQQVILDKADTALQLGAGMAEGFGHTFSSVDGIRRHQMLQKTYSGLFFARYLGQSLGGIIKSLPNEIKNDIYSYMEDNPQFADGVGIGTGHAYASLDESTRIMIFDKARDNLDLTRGLGFGFGLNFTSPNDDLKKLIADNTRNYSEFDKGIGMAVGTFYSKLPENLKNEVMNRAATSSEFSLGLGIYLAITYRDKVPKEFMEKLGVDSEIAHGLGMGWGAYFGYLPKDFQKDLLTKAMSNSRLELGLGSGLGFVFKHLSKETRLTFLALADKRPLLDIGLGFGLGFTWMYQKEEMRKEMTGRIRTNNMFAYGIAYGHGYHFNYNEPKIQEEILDLAHFSANFSIGLGYGLGYAFQNLGQEKRQQFLTMIEKLPSLGYGLGTGIGRIMNYMSETEQHEMLEKSMTHNEFARGIGFGIGSYRSPYMSLQEAERFFILSRENRRFSLGFAEGLGSSFEFLGEELAKRAMVTASTNTEFAFGLGSAFGRTFMYKPQSLREEFAALSKINVDLSEGLGAGLGLVFSYLDEKNRKQAFDRCLTDTGFAKGLGRGLGSILTDISSKLEDECYALTHLDQFAKGLGIGIGYTYPHLTNEKRASLSRFTENANVAEGIGEGVGSILQYITAEAKTEIMTKARNNKYFAKGLGRGFAYVYNQSDDSLRETIFGRIDNSGIGAGLGSGFGMIFHRLDPQFQDKLLQTANFNVPFAKALGFSLSYRYHDLTEWQSALVHRNVDANTGFALSLGYGLGKHFTQLRTEKQELIIKMIGRNNDFDVGLGYGLGITLGHLDPVIVRHLLKQTTQETDFASAIGYAIGYAFPSMPPDLQHDILLIHPNSSHQFADGLGKGLAQSSKYLRREVHDQVTHLFRSGDLMPAIVSLQKEIFEYDELPISGVERSHAWELQPKEISFSGRRQDLCVGIIDMIGSTRITATLNENQVAKYYAIFLNSMATIAKNFGAVVIKNVGDALLFYFPRTSNENNALAFKDVLECGLVMIEAHDMINARLMAENLPSLNYRISAEYGKVEIATSASSEREDLFGPAMNATAKINSKATSNGLVIGEALFQKVNGMQEYAFEKANDVLAGLPPEYSFYHVRSKERRSTINPFKKTAQ